MIRSIGALTVLALTLSACAPSGPPRTPRAVIDRALASAPGAAQPSTIVATELAFARMAREEGQWDAFREYAAEGAMIHGRNGPVPASAIYNSADEPEEAVQWAPRAIWMSCDGVTAVSSGRFRDADGLVGTFVTVWQRQSDNEYRYVYDVGSPDNPQPPPAAPDAPPEPDEIVVSAINAIEGHVADCPRRGETVPDPSLSIMAGNARYKVWKSRDGTLQWVWEHREDGTRVFRADFYSEGSWKPALRESWAPGEAG